MGTKERLIGVLHWPRYRFLGRCWAVGCGRLMVLHSPWAMYDCARTPLAIALTDKGQTLALKDEGGIQQQQDATGHHKHSAAGACGALR
jgi:hypothetical protein